MPNVTPVQEETCCVGRSLAKLATDGQPRSCHLSLGLGRRRETGLGRQGGRARVRRVAPTRAETRTRATRAFYCPFFSPVSNGACLRRLSAYAQFKVYLLIEGGLWLPACYLCCYRFQPTLRLMASPLGRRAVARSGAAIERYAPSWHASLVRLASKIEGAPATRAFGEWALINKVLAPVGFPTKMWIAHRIVEWRNGTALTADA